MRGRDLSIAHAERHCHLQARHANAIASAGAAATHLQMEFDTAALVRHAAGPGTNRIAGPGELQDFTSRVLKTAMRRCAPFAQR